MFEIKSEPKPVPELQDGDRLTTNFGGNHSRKYVYCGPGEHEGDIILNDVTNPKDPHWFPELKERIERSIRSGFTTVTPKAG